MAKSRVGMRLALATGALAVSLGAGQEASACGGEWIPALESMDHVDYRPQGVARAERDLEQGRYSAAAGAILRMMPHVKSLQAKESASIVARAQRVLAVATARGGGTLNIQHEVPKFIQGTWLGQSAQERRTNLEFAVATLEHLSELKKDDPAVQTELAEALAGLDDRQAEAKELLEKLAKKDLVSTPEGYATLAKLRKSHGDDAGHVAAVKRCQAMSENPQVCATRDHVSAKS